MRYCLLVLLILCLCACAKSVPAPSISFEDSEKHWQRYVDSGAINIGPFRTQMSLRFGVEGNTRRVTAILWGNNHEELRLDVNAGIGVSVAKIYESEQVFLIYAPREDVAYIHHGTQKPLFQAGVPIPFNLHQLTQIIEGKYSAVFGTKRNTNPSQENQINSFTLIDTPFAGTLTLNTQGLPVFWQEQDKQGWSLSLGYNEHELLPYKMTMEHKKTGKRAILLIKNRELSLAPFTAEQMRLILPSNISVLPLEQAQALY